MLTLLSGATASFTLVAPSEDWQGEYAAIEVERSTASQSGPWTALHSSAYAPAIISFGGKAGYPVTGTTLELLVDRRYEVSVSFSSDDIASISSAISSALPQFLTSVEIDNDVTIETISVGVGAALRVTGGDAAGILGITDAFDQGVDARIRLVQGKEVYRFVDPEGSDDYYYRARYVDTDRSRYGEYTIPYQSQTTRLASNEQLTLGTLRMQDASGVPIESLLLTVHVDRQAAFPEVAPSKLTAYTDRNGLATILLRRGLIATVTIPGTNESRRIQVPTDSDTFDFLDSSLVLDQDAYQVQIPQFQPAARRSL